MKNILCSFASIISLCLLLPSCGPAIDASASGGSSSAIADALNSSLFNVEITQRADNSENYLGSTYIIRVRGEKAVVFIPNIGSDPFAVFGGNYSSTRTEYVDMDVSVKDLRKGSRKFTLRSERGSAKFVEIIASSVGTAHVTYRGISTHPVPFLGKIVIPDEE